MAKPLLSPKLALFLIATCVLAASAAWLDSRTQNSGADLVFSRQNHQTDAIEAVRTEEVTVTEPETSVNTIPIYLVGAVEKPGIYQVMPGSYLYELIEQAGGLTADAAAMEIDLAMKIMENGRIQIPTVVEFENQPQKDWSSLTQARDRQLIDINRASLEDLDTLPGIGPATAKSILDYRARNGPFKSIDDLTQVPGIKQSRLDAIAELITLN